MHCFSSTLTFKYVAIFTTLILLVVACEFQKFNNKSGKPTINQQIEQLTIKNASSREAHFDIGNETNFLKSKEQIISEINLLSSTEQVDLSVAAWLYVTDFTEHGEPITRNNWAHDPVIFINSLGVGLCDDRASVLAILWTWLGYQSRVWELSGHVVPEVYDGSQWKLFDPDLQVYYFNIDGTIAGVKDIQSNGELITNAQLKDKMLKHSIASRDSYVLENRYSATISEIYTSVDDNFLLDWFVEIEPSEHNFGVRLPEKSAIKYPIEKSINYQNDTHSLKLIQLKIYSSKMTKIQIPLVLVQVESNEGITTNDKSITTYKQTMDLNFNLFDKEVTIDKIRDSASLYYMINPKIMKDFKNFKIINNYENSDSVEIKVSH